MKKILNIACLILVLFVAFSCKKNNDTPVEPVLPLNYANISGVWKLTQWNGVQQEDSPYVYMVLNRAAVEDVIGMKVRLFDTYQNMGSDKSHHTSGVYSIDFSDDYDDYIVTGYYDSGNGLWNNDYFVKNIKANQMTWIATDNPDDVSVYTRVAEVPKEVINHTKSQQ